MENNLESKEKKDEPPDIRWTYAENILKKVFSKTEDSELICRIFSMVKEDKDSLQKYSSCVLDDNKRYNTFQISNSLSLMREMRKSLYNDGLLGMNESVGSFIIDRIQPVLRAFYIEKYCRRGASCF
ncbi:MAG: hypothetical protein AABW65_00230 [Nanoarchaeota archaeon]